MATCRLCRTPIFDRVSLRYRVGPKCRKRLTADQLERCRQLTAAENDPTAIPPARRPSWTARRNNAAARQAAAPSGLRLCEHDGEVGRCPMCRREQSMTIEESTARFIARLRIERDKDRK